MLTNDGFLPSSNSLASQLSQTIKAGLPLESALHALAAQSNSARTQYALLKLKKSLESGMSLEQAFKESKSTLPESLKSLIAIGIETGRMDEIMHYCVERSQRSVTLQQYVWLTLSYPLFLVWMAVSICWVATLTVISAFKGIFESFGTELPGITQAMIDSADLLTATMDFFGLGWLRLALVPVLGMILWMLFILAGINQWGVKSVSSIPVIGRIFQYAALSEFCELVGFLVQSNVPFSKIIVTAGNSTDNRWLQKKCRQVAHDIDHGISPADAARVSDFPNSIVHVFREIDSRKNFAAAMHGLREVFAAQSHVASQVISHLVANFSIGCVVSFAFMFGLSIFFPLIKLLNDLS